MGGDHKCPVCEATFTRPQHVARHMRSHTGDRPYKCQYCGDQFARSDLLSRHVNKCHANEKPLPSTGVRRKGSASASRATTSKQVCDQCVQANTSCDGCNPCAKCIQRKFRCTFVKFHRQTAPVGPGHNIRLESSSSPPSPDPMAISSRAPIYHHHQSEDDFILGPPPTVVPTMAEALYGATPFTFPPLYPTNDMGGDSPDYVGKYRAHAELFGSARSGMNANTSSAMNSASTGLGPNLYDPRPPSTWLGWAQPDVTDAYHQQQRHVDLTSDPPPSLSPHAASSAMNDKDMQAELVHHQHQQQQQRSTTNHYLNLSVPYPVPLSASNYHHLSDPNNTNGNTIGGDSTDIIDFHGSDSASHSSCSVPSSAASSSVHLPLAMNANVAIVDSISARRRRSLLAGGGGAYDNNGALLIPDRAATSSTSSSSSSHHHDHRQNQNAFQQSKHVPFSTHDQNALSSNHHHHQHHHHRQHQHQPHPHSHPQPQPQPHHHHLQQMISVGDNLGRPEFSSAFGLLSLDDPNVMAGISTDGTPFFDDPGQAHNQPRSNTSGSTTVLGDAADMDTPMPLKQDSGQLQLLSLGGSASSSGQRFPMPTSSTAGAIVENGSPLSKERDAKELKEFWKQYMRIPLSGSGVLSSGGSEGISPSGGIGNKSTTNAPVPGPAGYRRPRVASLPTVKTPIVERDRDHFNLGFANAIYQNQILQPSISTSTSYASNPDLRRSSHEMPGMGMDMDMSMSIGDTEDLRSYEAAVMARKAPTTLNLKVRRPMRGRGRARGGGGVPDSGTGDKSRDEGSVSASSRNSPGAGGGDTITSSDCSSSSSLANAFGTGRRRPSHSRDKTLLASGGGRLNSSATFGRLLFPAGSSRSAIDPIKKEESSSPSLSSPASSSDFEGEAGDQSDMGGPSPLIGGNLPRPSFKRLPSQTLGPDNPKRPFYGFGGEDSMEDRSVGGWGVGGGGDVIDDDDGLIEKRDVLVGVSIAERRRRMSEPSTTGSGAVGNFEREGKRKQNNEKSSRGDVSAVQNVDEAMVS